jgi:SAM-dependent methyltransferase
VSDAFVRSDHVSYFQQHGQVFAYHDLFGYLMGISPDVVEVLEQHLGAARTRAEMELAFGDRFDRSAIREFLQVFTRFLFLVPPGTDELEAVWDTHPVRARWTVYHQPAPDSLTFWLTDRRGSSRAESPPAWAARLWHSIDGEASVRQLHAGIGEDVEPGELLATVASWVRHDRQVLRLSSLPVSLLGPEHQWPAYLLSSMPYAPWRPGIDPVPDDPLDRVGEPVNPPHAYYAEEVRDAARRFDEVETTLSHVFRRPHPALGGASFGEALVDALVDGGRLSEATADIVELGGGHGDLAAGALAYVRELLPATYEGLTYTIIDLSPALRTAQEATLAAAGIEPGRVRWVTANAEALPAAPSSADLILSNEVIGDLTAVKLTRELLDAPPSDNEPEAVRSFRAHGLPHAGAPDDGFYYNLGAVKLVEWVAAALRPGGSAYISEYGGLGRWPVPATHLDHIEVSIHFGHLAHVAKQLALEVEVEPLLDLFPFDFEAPMLATTRSWFLSLRALLASRNLALEKVAYTRAMMLDLLGSALPIDEIGDLRFNPLNERCMGLKPHEFHALLLRKPTRA